MAPRLILASSSPRRAQLLKEAGIAFEIVPTNVDERIAWGAQPVKAAVEVAARKANAVKDKAAWVLAADTIVVYQQKILGKPADEFEAHAMLRMLSSGTHVVITGVAVRAPDGTVRSGAATTRVTFRDLSDEEIDVYVRSGDPMDKAGAYGIQGKAKAFVSKVDGAMDNVIGLPVDLVRKLIAEAGWPEA